MRIQACRVPAEVYLAWEDMFPLHIYLFQISYLSMLQEGGVWKAKH